MLQRNGNLLSFMAFLALVYIHSNYFLQCCSIGELDEKDRIRKEKEISQNSRETFILHTQAKLSQEEFESLTTEEERTKISR